MGRCRGRRPFDYVEDDRSEASGRTAEGQLPKSGFIDHAAGEAACIGAVSTLIDGVVDARVGEKDGATGPRERS